MQELWNDIKEILSPYLLALIVLAGSALVGLTIRYILIRWVKIRRITQDQKFTRAILRRLHPPARWLFPFLVLILSEPILEEVGSEYSTDILHHFTIMGVIISASWFLINTTYLLEDYIHDVYLQQVEDKSKFHEQRVVTQVQYIRRILIITIVILGVAFILLSFEKMRRLGAGILTSAGVAGVIVGFAAQRTLANLLAGFQIAFTQPIRLNDVVIVETEWGKIEEITLTYVVVRIWDERGLVLPITYFTQTPFQNWTRNHTQLMGTVFIYVDYHMPIDPIRQELKQLLESSDLWDGRVQNVVVTNATERTMEVRALMSAADASELWDLRCHVREGLISFIQENYPEHLPRVRATFEPVSGGDEN